MHSLTDVYPEMSNYWKRFSLLAFLSLVISGYLLFHFTEVVNGYQEEKSFCSINATFDCDTVARSPYSSLLGMPTAGWAFVYYLVLLVYVFVSTKDADELGERATQAANAIFFYIALSIPPSLLLLAASQFVLKKYCLFCIGLDVANLLLLITALRCPARSKGLVTAFVSGGKTFLSQLFFFEPAPARRGLAPGLVLWATALLGFCAVHMTPDALIRNYFAPRRANRTDQKYLQPFVENWRDAKIENVPISPSDSPADRDYSIGALNAPITVIGFSDFECPFCKRTALVLKPFIEKRFKDFRFVFKNYPIDQSCNSSIKTPKHQYACRAAAIARCAGMQKTGADSEGLFWKTHDALMARDSFSDEIFSEVIKSVGLNEQSMAECLKNKDAMTKVITDADEGIALKVVSTPTIFVNGKRIMVPPPYVPGVLEMILEEVTKRRNAPPPP